jgi:hypothetical protein
MEVASTAVTTTSTMELCAAAVITTAAIAVAAVEVSTSVSTIEAASVTSVTVGAVSATAVIAAAVAVTATVATPVIAVVPGAGTDEDATDEPVRPVVSVGGTIVRGIIVVAIGADWRGAVIDGCAYANAEGDALGVGVGS